MLRTLRSRTLLPLLLAGSCGALEIVIDNDATGFARIGTWTTVSDAAGQGGSYLTGTGNLSCAANWRPTIATAGRYKVEVCHGNLGDTATRDNQATFTIVHAAGSARRHVDQNLNPGVWTDLGTYAFYAGTDGEVHVIHDSSTAGATVADAVRFTLVAAETVVKPAKRVMVFSKVQPGEYYHTSIPNGVAMIQALGAANNFAVDDNLNNAAWFTADRLAKYAAVIWNNNQSECLDTNQENAFKGYIQAGGAFVGIHAGVCCEWGWTWFHQLIGADFTTHPPIQTGTVVVEDRNHISTAHYPASFAWNDEWYEWKVSPRTRSGVRVLMRVDESTYTPSKPAGDHPVAWCQTFEGGRSWFTALGHKAEAFSDASFKSHVLGGIQWAINRPPTVTVAAPAAGAIYVAPAGVAVTAQAADADGAIAKVEFLIDGTVAATRTTAPWNTTLTGIAAGNHALTIRATDNLGDHTTSPATAIQVVAATTGFRNAFDGLTLDGWVVRGKATASQYSWTVESGQIVGTSTVFEPSVLSLDRSYGDFELILESQCPIELDSGVYTRGILRSDQAVAGMHCNIEPYRPTICGHFWDEIRRNRWIDATGTCPGLKKGTADWNEYRIRCEGRRYRSWINGVTATDFSDTIDEVPGIVGLQLHTFRSSDFPNARGPLYIRWRNIRINSPPTVGAIASVSVPAGGTSAALPFTIGDDETAPGSLTVTATSGNTTVLPAAGIVLGGSGAARTLTVKPAAAGTAVVTVNVSDGNFTRTTTCTVTANGTVNQPPTVRFTHPLADGTLLTGQDLRLIAEATDSDGNVVTVEFIADGTVIQTERILPWDWTWTGLTAGTHTLVARATDNQGAQTSTAPITITVRDPVHAAINFQPASAPAMAGWLVDGGLPFGDRGDGLSYGWNIDLSATTRDRNAAASADQLHDTLVHLQKAGTENATWEIAVPNGTYQVRLIAGDPSFFDSVFRIAAEGVVVIDGTPSTTQPWFDQTATVTVGDGRLTVGSATGASNNKLNAIEIHQIPTTNG